MLGDLHIEQSLVITHGEIMKGSGMKSILEKNKLSTLGRSTLVRSRLLPLSSLVCNL